VRCSVPTGKEGWGVGEETGRGGGGGGVVPSVLYICALYHPPKANYEARGLVAYLETTIASMLMGGSDVVILLAGDFNQLSDSEIISLGLISLVNKPTHMGHFLDRIYCSKPLYNNIKLISSSIPTKHSMVIARPDSEFIIDQNKKRRTVYTRRRSPPQDCKVLNLLANVDWSPVYIATSVQSAFDAFYVILHFIINLVYPSRRVTLTSRDPPYITPNIKFMLRRRNKMMRGGRVHEANALSVKIGAAIASFNSRQLSDIDLLKDGVGGMPFLPCGGVLMRSRVAGPSIPLNPPLVSLLMRLIGTMLLSPMTPLMLHPSPAPPAPLLLIPRGLLLGLSIPYSLGPRPMLWEPMVCLHGSRGLRPPS